MMSTAAWADARKLAGSMSLKPTSCCSSSSGVSARSFVDVLVISKAILLVPECGSDRDRRPRIPTECKPDGLFRPPNERSAGWPARNPEDGLLHGEGAEEVLGVGGRAGLGYHHQHVEPVADEAQAKVDGLTALLDGHVARRRAAQGGIARSDERPSHTGSHGRLHRLEEAACALGNGTRSEVEVSHRIHAPGRVNDRVHGHVALHEARI